MKGRIIYKALAGRGVLHRQQELGSVAVFADGEIATRETDVLLHEMLKERPRPPKLRRPRISKTQAHDRVLARTRE